MTNERAILILKAYKKQLEESVSNQLDADIDAFEFAIKALEERQTGTWSAITSPIIDADTCIICSNCNGEFIGKNTLDVWRTAHPFCPNCGADMRGDE